MAWPSKINYRGKGMVRLTDRSGAVMVPRETTVTVTGENGHPDASVKIAVRDGRPEVVEVHVVAKPRGREIRTSDMAVFNLDNWVANVLGELGFSMKPVQQVEVDDMTTFYSDADPDPEKGMWETNRVVREVRAADRRTSSEVELERVAEIYREHADRAPVEAVMSIMGYGSRRTASRRIKAAEEAGLLPATGQGRKRL